MKTATFYELKSKDIVVSSDYFQLARFQLRPFPIDEGLWGTAMRDVDVVSVPIHHIRKCTKIENVYGADGQEPIETQDYFIAMSPEVASFLSTPFEEKARKANAEKQKAIEELHVRNAELKEWWAMPMWKRVWSAIRG